jgi:hypothetical protein
VPSLDLRIVEDKEEALLGAGDVREQASRQALDVVLQDYVGRNCSRERDESRV